MSFVRSVHSHAGAYSRNLMALAVGIFVAALAVIASERVDRTKVALLGATLVLLTQTIDQEQAI